MFFLASTKKGNNCEFVSTCISCNYQIKSHHQGSAAICIILKINAIHLPHPKKKSPVATGPFLKPLTYVRYLKTLSIFKITILLRTYS